MKTLISSSLSIAVICTFFLFTLGFFDCQRTETNTEVPPNITFIVGGVLINPNDPPIRNSLIIIKDGEIRYVGEKNTPLYKKYAKLANIISAKRKFIIPGLIDMHVHYEPWMGKLFLAKGVTTVKDTGNDPDWILKEKARIQASPSTAAPRIFACGPVIDGKDPIWDMYSSHIAKAANEEEAREIVKNLVAKDVDCIKTYINLSERALGALIDEAHRSGRTVTGHLGRVDALEAASMGIDEIEHISGVAEACLTKEARQKVVNNRDKHNSPTRENWPVQPWSFVNPECMESLISLLVKHEVAINPTFVVYDRISHLNDPRIRDIPALEYVPFSEELSYLWAPDNYFAVFGTKPWGKTEYLRARKQQQARMKFIRTFVRSGGLVVSGSDTPNPYVVPGFGLHRELQLLAEASLTPRDALKAATINAAKVLQKESHLGSIEVGKDADIVILNGNPLKDISHLENIDLVFKQGIEFRPSKLLEQARQPITDSMQAPQK